MTTADPKAPITDMKLEPPVGAAPAFDAAGLAKALLRATRAGTLATLDPESGFPLATLVNVATDHAGRPLLLLSGLSLHTRNLARDPRASLLLVETGKGDPLAHPRLTLVGTFAKTLDGMAERRFLSKHPKSKLYVDLPDFAFFVMDVKAVHLNGGFARAATLGPADVLTDTTGAEPLIAAEPSAIEHMNQDHTDAVQLYATRLAGEKPGAWTVTGIDPDGLDLGAGDRTARVAFPRRATGPGPLAKILKEMANDARGRES
jgi:putative heme iron utilization protein